MLDLESASRDFERALLALDRLAAGRILSEARVASSLSQVLEQVVVLALERVGAAWEDGKLALSQVYMSAHICDELVGVILPAGDPGRRNRPRTALAVLEDYHGLGKRIVWLTLRAAGFEVLDYGLGISAEDLVDRVRADGVEILLISTLMLSAALRVGEVRRRLNELGLGTRIVVGGAPFRFDTQLWREVGADAMAREASEAVGIIKRLTEAAA